MKKISNNKKIFVWICTIAIVIFGCNDIVKPEIDSPDINRSGINEIVLFDIDLTQYEEYTVGDKVLITIVAEDDSVSVFVPWYVSNLSTISSSSWVIICRVRKVLCFLVSIVDICLQSYILR